MATGDERDDMTRTLKRWRWTEERQAEARDPMVLAALALGFSIEDVHQMTGLGRSTIDRIIKKEASQ